MIAIISDTHDDDEIVAWHLELFEEESVDVVIHLGDVTHPDTLWKYYDYEVHLVGGNGDVAFYQELRDLLNDDSRLAAMDGEFHGWSARISFGEKRFLFRHGMERNPSYVIAATDDAIDYVCHGHYHHQERTPVSGGEVLMPARHGAYLYDETTDTFEHHDMNQ